MWGTIFHHNRQAVKIVPIKAGGNIAYFDGYFAHWLEYKTWSAQMGNCGDRKSWGDNVSTWEDWPRGTDRLRFKIFLSFWKWKVVIYTRRDLISEKLAGLTTFRVKRRLKGKWIVLRGNLEAIWWTRLAHRLCPYYHLFSPWVPLGDGYQKFLDSRNTKCNCIFDSTSSQLWSCRNYAMHFPTSHNFLTSARYQ